MKWRYFGVPRRYFAKACGADIICILLRFCRKLQFLLYHPSRPARQKKEGRRKGGKGQALGFVRLSLFSTLRMAGFKLFAAGAALVASVAHAAEVAAPNGASATAKAVEVFPYMSEVAPVTLKDVTGHCRGLKTKSYTTGKAFLDAQTAAYLNEVSSGLKADERCVLDIEQSVLVSAYAKMEPIVFPLKTTDDIRTSPTFQVDRSLFKLSLNTTALTSDETKMLLDSILSNYGGKKLSDEEKNSANAAIVRAGDKKVSVVYRVVVSSAAPFAKSGLLLSYEPEANSTLWTEESQESSGAQYQVRLPVLMNASGIQCVADDKKNHVFEENFDDWNQTDAYLKNLLTWTRDHIADGKCVLNFSRTFPLSQYEINTMRVLQSLPDLLNITTKIQKDNTTMSSFKSLVDLKPANSTAVFELTNPGNKTAAAPASAASAVASTIANALSSVASAVANGGKSLSPAHLVHFDDANLNVPAFNKELGTFFQNMNLTKNMERPSLYLRVENLVNKQIDLVKTPLDGKMTVTQTFELTRPGLSKLMIALIVVCSVIAAGLLILLVVCICKTSKKKNTKKAVNRAAASGLAQP